MLYDSNSMTYGKCKTIGIKRGSLLVLVFSCLERLARGFPHGSAGKESACNAADLGSNPGPGRSPGEGNGNPVQYSNAQRIPWTEEPGGLQSMRSQRAGRD